MSTHILQPHVNSFVLVCLDGDLVFSCIKEEHLKHLESVCSLLAEHKFHLCLDKCRFGKNKLEYLGHTISASGIQPESLNLKAVIGLPQWASKYAASYRYITDKYKRIHTYPTGIFLLHKPAKKCYTLLGPTPWPVDVFLADSLVEQREVQSYESAKLTKHLKSRHISNRKISSGKIFRSLPQDCFTIHLLSCQSPCDLLIVQPARTSLTEFLNDKLDRFSTNNGFQ